MTTQNPALLRALTDFHDRFFQAFQDQTNSLPFVDHDPEWPSPCEQASSFADEAVIWHPVACDPVLSFDNIERALELQLHPDIKTYYGSFYCANLAAKTDDGELELLFAWSPKDFERLQENILGHIWMKRKLRQDETVFFAVTDIDDVILTMNNRSGEIWAERVGKKPHRKVADSMEAFLQGLSPVV